MALPNQRETRPAELKIRQFPWHIVSIAHHQTCFILVRTKRTGTCSEQGMTRISRSISTLPIPIRSSDRRGGGAGIVNPVSSVTPDRNSDGRDLRAFVEKQGGGKQHAAGSNLRFTASGRLFAGMHMLGQQERARLRPGAYEAASRYEDRYFERPEAGLIQRRSA